MRRKPELVPRPRVDDRPVWDLIFGVLHLPVILVAHELGLFSFVAARRPTLAQLCRRYKLAARPAAALLEACVALGLMRLRGGAYALTPLAEDYLLPQSPFYFGGFLDVLIFNYASFSFARVKQAILHDEPRVYERGAGDFWARPEHERRLVTRAFTLGMHGHSAAAASAWPRRLSLARHELMLDVGGGSGAHTVSAVRRWPHLRAIIFDTPYVCEVTARLIKAYGLRRRIAVQPGDMWRDAFPAADVHFYSDVFHDWPPEGCRALAQKSFAELEPGGRIVLHEMIYNDRKTGPAPVAAYNTAMLLWTAGRQYARRELTGMLAAAGFSHIEVRPTFGYWHVITGTKPRGRGGACARRAVSPAK